MASKSESGQGCESDVAASNAFAREVEESALALIFIRAIDNSFYEPGSAVIAKFTRLNVIREKSEKQEAAKGGFLLT
jgi:hypothetical protein